ncbi:MAG: hypothetical protein EA357_06360 [Micavibrio sp.]|nr:MAG: hypothetical protein EA357_06360 [Micavibrio sp.]
MANDNTRPNVKHYVGKTVNNYPAWIALSAMATGGLFTVLPNAMDTEQHALEHPGTAAQEEVVNFHETRLAELQALRGEIGLLKAQAGLGDENTEQIGNLTSEFSRSAVTAYLDLYLHGATEDGPALSEENFDRLRSDFKQNVANPADFGFQKTIATGYLDEAMAATRINTSSDGAKFEAVKDMNQKMAGEVKDASLPYFLAVMGSMASTFLLFLLCASAYSWREQPARVPRRKKPKSGFNH